MEPAPLPPVLGRRRHHDVHHANAFMGTLLEQLQVVGLLPRHRSLAPRPLASSGAQARKGEEGAVKLLRFCGAGCEVLPAKHRGAISAQKIGFTIAFEIHAMFARKLRRHAPQKRSNFTAPSSPLRACAPDDA